MTEYDETMISIRVKKAQLEEYCFQYRTSQKTIVYGIEMRIIIRTAGFPALNDFENKPL